MLQAIVLIATLLLNGVRWLTGLGAAGSAGTAILGVFVGSILFKALDFLALGFVTYQISDSLMANALDFVRDQLAELNSFQFIPDLIDTLQLPQALSLIFSAISISLTIAATKTALRIKK